MSHSKNIKEQREETGKEEFLKDKNGLRSVDENYFCHITIPSKNYRESKIFFEKIFGWKVIEQPEISFLDIHPPSRKGPSAELNSEVEVIVPSIKTSDIEAKLKLIERLGGRKLKGKTPIGEDAKYRYYALFEEPSGEQDAPLL